MAMNKADQARMQALRELCALRIEPDVQPDVIPPNHPWKDSSEGYIGYAPNTHSNEIRLGHTTYIKHSEVWIDKTATDPFSQIMKMLKYATSSQGTRSYWSKRVDALRHIRYAMAKKAARELAEIDRIIDEELANPCQFDAIIAEFNQKSKEKLG